MRITVSSFGQKKNWKHTYNIKNKKITQECPKVLLNCASVVLRDHLDHHLLHLQVTLMTKTIWKHIMSKNTKNGWMKLESET